jgi:ribosomal protein S3AE
MNSYWSQIEEMTSKVHEMTDKDLESLLVRVKMELTIEHLKGTMKAKHQKLLLKIRTEQVERLILEEE